MKKLMYLFLLFAVPSALFVSCGKEDENDATKYKEPTIASRGEVIEIPSGLQTQADNGDYNALYAVSFMGIANSISNFASSFTVPEDADKSSLKSGSVLYHWTYSGYSYWMIFTEGIDKYTWKYDYELPGIPRFTFIEAEEKKTGKEGMWAIYEADGTHDIVWDYNWNINSSNTFSAIMKWYSDEAEDEGRFEVVDNEDNSGSFKYFIANVKYIEVTWNKNGSGSWWVKVDGGTDVSGSWTAK